MRSLNEFVLSRLHIVIHLFKGTRAVQEGSCLIYAPLQFIGALPAVARLRHFALQSKANVGIDTRQIHFLSLPGDARQFLVLSTTSGSVIFEISPNLCISTGHSLDCCLTTSATDTYKLHAHRRASPPCPSDHLLHLSSHKHTSPIDPGHATHPPPRC